MSQSTTAAGCVGRFEASLVPVPFACRCVPLHNFNHVWHYLMASRQAFVERYARQCISLRLPELTSQDVPSMFPGSLVLLEQRPPWGLCCHAPHEHMHARATFSSASLCLCLCSEELPVDALGRVRALSQHMAPEVTRDNFRRGSMVRPSLRAEGAQQGSRLAMACSSSKGACCRCCPGSPSACI